MSNWTSIDIRAGSHSWHYEPATDAGLPTGVLGDVLAGLKVETNFSDDHPLQGIPNPSTASFDVLVGDFAELADLRIGDEVSLIMWNGEPYEVLTWFEDVPGSYRYPLIHWLGRVAELTATPGVHNGEPVVQVHVDCVDRLADLSALTVGAGAWPEENIAERFNRIWESGAKLPPTYYSYTWWGTAAAREAGEPVPMLDAIQSVCESNAATENTYQVWYNPEHLYWTPGTEWAVTLDPATDKFTPANPADIGDLAVGDFVLVVADPMPDWLGKAARRVMWQTHQAKVLTIDAGTGAVQLTPAFGVGAGSPIDLLYAETGVYLAPGDTAGVDLDHLQPEEPYTLVGEYKRIVKGNAETPRHLPLVLSTGDNGLLPVVEPFLDEQVIPAGMVELSTQWRKAKEGSVDKVVATAKGGEVSAVYLPNAVPTEYRIETELKDAPILAAIRLLPEGREDGWTLDDVTILDLPYEVMVPWFSVRYLQGAMRHPVLIDELVSTVNPNGQSWFAGMFRNGEIELGEDGRWTIKATLASDIARSMVYYDEFPWYTQADPGELYPTGNEPYLSAQNLAASAMSGILCSDFDPTVTAYDIRLVRRP